MATLHERALCTLLGPGRLIALYQPLIDLRHGATTGFEILARWQRDTHELLSPSFFIPKLEHAGSIHLLTRTILAQAFEAAADLPPTCGLSVNVSALQLRGSGLCRDVAEIAAEYAFSLERLTVEVTESAYIQNFDQARQILETLKSLGASLALDDFGTGYSSLTHLHALPFDELKIDQSFVRSMTGRRESRKIVAAVVSLGRSLGLSTVAEGVEEQCQADMLKVLGCERAQGWLYGRPLAVEAMKCFVRETHPTPQCEAPSRVEANNLCLEALPTETYAQLRAIYDGAPVGLCFLDCDLRYVSLNRRLASFNGVPLELHLGRTVEEIAPLVYEQVKGYLRRALAGEAISDVAIQLHTPGSRRETRMLSYQPAFDEAGEVVGVSIAVVDLTARREAEERLRESEDHYRSMVELNPQVLWTMDSSGLTLEVSSRWEQFAGQSAEEARGLGWLRALHPDDLEPTVARCLESIRESKPLHLEYRVRKEGAWSWIRSRGAPRFNEKNEVIRWYGSAESIDEEIAGAEQLRAAAERLQAVVDAIPIGIVIAEFPGGRVISRNPAAQAILHLDPLGLKSVQDYGKKVAYFREGQRMRSDQFPLARALQQGITTKDESVFFELGDGIGKWLLLSGAPFRSSKGAILGAVATIQECKPPTAPLHPAQSQGANEESDGRPGQAPGMQEPILLHL